MRFLVDESTGPKVARWLRDQGYEVFSVYEQSQGISDEDVIRKACREDWILITNDKDFGDKVFRENHAHRGVVLLRLSDERSAVKIETLQKLLSKYSDHLPEAFVVVTETRIRFAQQR